METIAIIPARGGSKRLPGKNLMELGGIPLVAHSILYARSCGQVDGVYVSTDDSKIKAVALEYGAQVIDRPKAISGDNEPTVTALQHVLGQIPAKRVVLLQPTNPLRPMHLLSDALESFGRGTADSLFTVTRSHHKLGMIHEDSFIPYNYEPGQRSQDLEPLYYENGLLYVCGPEVIMAGQIITPEAFPWIVEHPFGAADIDTLQDFEFAEFLYQKYKHEESLP